MYRFFSISLTSMLLAIIAFASQSAPILPINGLSFNLGEMTSEINTNVSVSTSSENTYQNDKYGYRLSYTAALNLEGQWESGASHITSFSSQKTEFSKVYIVVENFDPAYKTIETWLSEREPYFMGILEVSSPVILDGVSGVQRIYRNEEAFHLAQYYLANNKIYTVNIGPLSEAMLPDDFYSTFANNFHWLEGNYLEPVPEIPSTQLEIPHTNTPSAAPVLQFPFCGSWYITNGYYYQTPGHAYGPWTSYALDWIASNGNTYQAPIYAAHSGTVYVWWDSSGGGNASRVLYGDPNYETVYLHLYDYIVTSGGVNAGTQIARADCTGTACSGNHLHFAYVSGGTGNWQSIIPEPMSGVTGLAPGQTHTRNCGGGSCCGCGAQSTDSLLAAYPSSENFYGPPASSVNNSLQMGVSDFANISLSSNWEMTDYTEPSDLTSIENASSGEIVPIAPEEQTNIEVDKILVQSWNLPANVIPPTSNNYVLAKSVVGISGNKKSSASFTVINTTGQFHETGKLQGQSYKVLSGFWPALNPGSLLWYIFAPIVTK